ncbi:two-component response regulator-like APRR9 [Silene latifolia]|uniref:two-component response regulator-like APRR9 n=1 Tax=Silene latifolia TaxID=37657 RepID=UPI003D783038
MGENNEEGMEVMMVENEGVEEVEVIEQDEGISDEFMPKMMLRVLLVEADDSTRQILTALLRKCNYKVAAISDGLQAWELLRKRHNNIDLVLTELDLPSISGYALLTLIMEHDACKHIPVIMTSSQDSISMVLKCMLKGAADFLIKPVRKNELKNLWRHVWRRLTINDSHDPRNLAIEQHNVDAKCENNVATDQSGDNVSTSWKNSKCSKKATDAQDLPWMKSSEEPELSNKETEHNPKHVKTEKGLPLLTIAAEGKPGSSESASRSKNEGEGSGSGSLREDEDRSSTGLATEDESGSPANHGHKANSDGLRSSDRCERAIDLIGSMKRQKCIVPQTSYNGDFNNINNSTPELELSLRRVHDSEIKELDEKRTLNHSGASAFSRYDGNKKCQTSSPLSISELTEVKGVAESSPLPKTVNIKQGDKPNAGPQSDPLPGSIVDGGVWTGYASKDRPSSSSLPGPGPDVSSKSQSSAFHREESPFLTSSSLNSGNSLAVGPSSSSTRCNEFDDEKKVSACESASEVTELNTNGPGMTETSVVKEVVKHEGCNNFELGQFRQKTALHSAQREAALAKFRLKRKGRCYEKKVRYQSRKKLAEQRVRVKGQFVRHVSTDQMATDDTKTS